jgi:hypothetical protein
VSIDTKLLIAVFGAQHAGFTDSTAAAQRRVTYLKPD